MSNSLRDTANEIIAFLNERVYVKREGRAFEGVIH